MGRIWITQLGVGFPESGGVYLTAAQLLDRIADAMNVNLAASGWEGQAADRSVAQGLLQRNAVVELEEIDKAVAVVVEAQAGQVTATRRSVYDTQNYLYQMKEAAEAMYCVGDVVQGTACESTAACTANSNNGRALSALADVTVHHTATVSGLNQQLTDLLAKLVQGTSASAGNVPPAGSLQSAQALRGAASVLRVDTPSLMERAVFSFVTSRWLAQPAAAVAGISRKVWVTHGRYTDGFNDQLRIFEVRRAEVIQKLQVDAEGRAAALAEIATLFDITDAEAARMADAYELL